MEIRSKIEIRADESRTSPGRISGTLLQTGRVAGDRQEVFTPGSVRWPYNGLRLLAEHRGRQVLRFKPVEDGTALRIDEKLPDTSLGREIAAEVRSGRKTNLSIEFHAIEDAIVSGVREVRSALVDAVALVADGAYDQAVVEVREKAKVPDLWL